MVADPGQVKADADDGPDAILKKNGLKAKGHIYVLETEEDDVQAKASETLLLAGRIRSHWMQKRAAMDAALRPQMINELEIGIAQLQEEIQLTDQTIGQIPKFRGQFYNILDQERCNDLVAYKTHLEQKLAQSRGFLKDLKSLPANPQWTASAEEVALADQKSYDEAVRELRQLVDATNRKMSAQGQSRDQKGNRGARDRSPRSE